MDKNVQCQRNKTLLGGCCRKIIKLSLYQHQTVLLLLFFLIFSMIYSAITQRIKKRINFYYWLLFFSLPERCLRNTGSFFWGERGRPRTFSASGFWFLSSLKVQTQNCSSTKWENWCAYWSLTPIRKLLFKDQHDNKWQADKNAAI